MMIENPIQQATLPGTTNILSNEIIEGAQKLMGTSSKKQPQVQNVSGIDMNALRTMIRDTVRDTVRDVVREELSKSGIDASRDIGFGKVTDVCPYSSLSSSP